MALRKTVKEFSRTILIVGLGNIGKRYERTFHNLGFMAVDRLAAELGMRFKKVECRAAVAEGYIKGVRIVIAKPQTYMNLSGESLRELVARFKVELNSLLVIYDDIDIARATIRQRESGSAGTHNGMKSVVECLSSTEFARLRIGVGAPPPEIPLADFVLMDIPKTMYEEFNAAIDSAVSAARAFIDRLC